MPVAIIWNATGILFKCNCLSGQMQLSLKPDYFIVTFIEAE